MSHKKLLLLCLIGTVIEWYDFALFGALSPLLSQIFFPHQTKEIALVLTLAIFATGFVMRPLGAVFFGHIGDKYGRKKAVILSVMIMMFATSIIGLLPILPSDILIIVMIMVVMRMLQGFSASGELAGVSTYLSETLKEDKRLFFYMSLMGSGELIGIVLGAIIGSIAFSLQHRYAFSWRIPFLLSLFLGLIAVYLRLKIIETPIFIKMASNNLLVRIPFITVIRKHIYPSLLVILLSISGSTATYFLALAYPLYMKIAFGSQYFFVSQISMLLVAAVCSPICAMFATCKNLTRYTAGSFILIAVSVVILSSLTTYSNKAIILLILGVGYAFCYAPLKGLIATIKCLLFPNNVRYTGMAVSMNLGIMIGGSFPLISTVLVHKTGNLIASGVVVGVLSFISAIVLILVGKVANPKI